MKRPVAVIAILLIATAGPALALSPLIERHVWAPTAVIGVGAAAVTLALARTLTAWQVRPTLIAIGVSTWAVLAYEFAGRAAGTWYLLPTTDSWRELIGLLTRGAETLRTGEAPIGGGAGVALIVGLALTVLFLAAEALALGADSPALAGAPLLLMWTPVAVLGPEVATGLILLSAGALVALLALSSLPRGSLAPAAPAVAGITAVTVLSTMILTPWALSYPSWIGSLAQESSTRIDLGLDVRSDLERGENTTLLRYRGLSPSELGPLHSHTLSDFDGQQWHPRDVDTWLRTSRLWPAGGASMIDDEGEARFVDITADGLDQDRLFLPEGPRETEDPVLYNPDRDELFASGGASGATGPVRYSLLRLPLHGEPELWHEKSLTPGQPRAGPDYLEQPATSKRADIDALTAQIVSGAASPYEKAVAIQQFLRTDDRFQYTTSVPAGGSDDAVWDFLEHGQGYCVQFATAMVTMARSAGIPARMAVGFLPGAPDPAADGPGGVIRAHDAHTWPQLYLGAAGWARFEPTPSTRSGPAPELAQGLPRDTSSDVAEEVPEPMTEASPVPREEEASPATSAPAAPPAESGPGPLWWVIAALAAAAGGTGLILHRRRERPRAEWGIEEYWRAATAALRPLGLSLAVHDTPTTVLRRAQELDVIPRPGTGGPDHLRGPDHQGDDSPEAEVTSLEWAAQLEPFARLTEEVNAARYAPAAPPGTPEEYARWVARTRSGARQWTPRDGARPVPGTGGRGRRPHAPTPR